MLRRVAVAAAAHESEKHSHSLEIRLFKPFCRLRRWVKVYRSIPLGLRAALAAAAFGLAGCSSISLPWLDTHATGIAQARAHQRANRRTLIAIGPLASPPHSFVSMGNIGAGISDALVAELMQRDDLDVRVDPLLAGQVQAALAGPPEQFARQLKQIQSRFADLQYVITGRVIDFDHAALKPHDIGKWEASRHRYQAVATIQLDIVDLDACGVLAADRINSSTWASEGSPAPIYRGMTFGSHRFWDTPLGLASRDVIDRAAHRIGQVIPVQDEMLVRIVQQIDERRVRLSSAWAACTTPGQVMFVCTYDASGTRLGPVIDPHTGKPLTAKIESRGLYPSAWIEGRWPANVSLRGAVLRRRLS